MASCYDCIHCGACSDAGDPGFSSLKDDVSKCKHFKNKADFAEVVRCSECIYCENMKCTELKDNSEHPLDVAIFDYCSQGLRRDVASDVE